MRASVRARATQVGEAFDREITRAYLLLQLDPATRERRDWPSYAARVQAWRASSAFPGMVNDLLLAERGTDGSVTLQRFNVDAGTFEPSQWPERAAPLRQWFETWGPVIQPIRLDIPALVMPTPDLHLSRGNMRIEAFEGRPAAACVFALLDAKYMTEKMLPELLRRQFGTGPALEYDAIVREREQPAKVLYASDASRAGATDPPDATVGLFELRLDMLADLRTSGLLGETAADGKRRFSFSILQTGPLRIQAGRTRARRRRRAVGADDASSRRVARGGGRQRAAAKPAAQLRHPRSARRQRRVRAALRAAGRASRGAAGRVRRGRVARASHAARGHSIAGENLADGVVSEAAQVRRYGTLVREEGERLTDLVEQVLAYAGIQSQHAAAARRPTAPSDLVAIGIAQSRDAIDRSGVRVETDVPPDLPRVLVDPAALGRAVANLVTNAIKYGLPRAEPGNLSAAESRGGDAQWVGISARARGGEVALTVSDRGAGIAPADLPRIFDPFYRAGSVVAAQIHGTGLGLTVVQGIARAHGGRVTVTSAPGQGSAFTIHLPAASPDVSEYPGVTEHPVPRAPQI